MLLDRKALIALQVQRNRRQQDDLIAANTQAIEQDTLTANPLCLPVYMGVYLRDAEASMLLKNNGNLR
ncbi:MAG TPA: hypothetical protein GXX48_05950 [Ochrobactrum intermedium]|uniref:Uncharacterized protein n=1 Tax=Brucella intermedia TaxID=94625 RepID=A0A7V6TYT0_9HYPH|nr:hypothetical protein [Brucella intermedia]HHV67170.1 hypothetical protein [Brucella intermedia]